MSSSIVTLLFTLLPATYLLSWFSTRSTDTRVETPFSCMVIPYKRSAAFIVPRLCVIIINCVFFVNFCKYDAKRPTFESSSAASISSRRQNGDGFRFWIAKRRAIACQSLFLHQKAASLFWSFLPGG